MTADSTAPSFHNGAEYAYRERELLVAITHRDLVIAALAELDLPTTVRTESDLLGLSRLELPPLDPPRRVSTVLKELYTLFEQKYGGWRPTIGKNRIVGRVVGSGELSWGGDGMPRPVGPPTVWPPSRGGAGRGARVAVLDTAAAEQSPLGGNWLDRYSDTFSIGSSAPDAASGHATFVAGLVLSQAPGATVEVRQVLDSDGQADAWDVATAIVEAGRAGADVINLSLVCYTKDGEPPMAISHALARIDPQTVVVAAAGNYGDHPDEKIRRRPTWPAALPGVIAVGACDNDGNVADFTPKDVPWIDVMTNGVELRSTYIAGSVRAPSDDPQPPDVTFDGFARWSGTSFAAALVSGAIAAGVDPGRVSAQTSLAALLRRAAPARNAATPPFLSLLADDGR